MDIGRAFVYPLDDENWITKVLIGGLFVLLTVFGLGSPFLLGYMVEIVGNILKGEELPLPSWSNLGDMFVKGLIILAVGIIYLLPLILSSFFLAVIAQLTSGGQISDNTGAGISMCLSCLSGLWLILVSLVFPAAMINYAQTGGFVSAFRFDELFRLITSNVGSYLVTVLLSWVVGLAGHLGTICCGVGFFFTIFWSSLVLAHLWGQIGRLAAPYLETWE